MNTVVPNQFSLYILFLYLVTLVLKLNEDMIHVYHHTKNNMLTYSKVLA